MSTSNIFSLLVQAGKRWYRDDPWRHAATIAYYAIFSLPGLLIIIIWTAGTLFGQDAIQGQLSQNLGALLGESGADSVESMIVNARLDQENYWMRALGIGTLMFGATTLFLQLQTSLNAIWSVQSAPKHGLLKLLADRATSLGIIIAIGFLLLISLVISTALSAFGLWFSAYFGENGLIVVRALNIGLSLSVVSLLFAIMFKVLPDVDIGWRSVWVGAFSAGLLFTIGKAVLSMYFAYSNPGSGFGAASSIILIMLWVNYTCLILFFGANLAQAYAVSHGHPITPSEHATWINAPTAK
jgi:membrane protein